VGGGRNLRLSARNVIHQQCACSSPVVATGHRPTWRRRRCQGQSTAAPASTWRAGGHNSNYHWHEKTLGGRPRPTTELAPRGKFNNCRSGKAHLKRSCPAVSHICNLTDFPPQFVTLDPNSTPIVCDDSCLTAGIACIQEGQVRWQAACVVTVGVKAGKGNGTWCWR